MTRRARAVVLRCSPGKTCSFHRDGGPELEKCPGVCDADGCTLDGHYEIGAERHECALHAGLTLLARAISQALARDNVDSKGGA
ncbi:MAG TPA: hypothetical protein VMT03_17780 [Polyangia bacterium]|nr:hypothetical protein [Polyangia bacterium]